MYISNSKKQFEKNRDLVLFILKEHIYTIFIARYAAADCLPKQKSTVQIKLPFLLQLQKHMLLENL